jgi:predicted DNA binding CopG/RHH family protein
MKQNARINARVSQTVFSLIKEDAETRGISNSKVLREIIIKHYTRYDR